MHPRVRAFGRELPSFLVMIAVVFAARSSLADHYTVPSGSMEFTLMPGDRIVVSKLAYGFRLPFTDVRLTSGPGIQRGEVVIFDSPEDGVRLVKRVVAVAGDSVSIQSGHLFINGVLLVDPSNPEIERFGSRQAMLNLGYGGGEDLKPTLITDGHVLTIGDARGNSKDGRVFGPVEASSVYGRAVAVYYRSGEGLCWKGL